MEKETQTACDKETQTIVYQRYNLATKNRPQAIDRKQSTVLIKVNRGISDLFEGLKSLNIAPFLT